MQAVNQKNISGLLFRPLIHNTQKAEALHRWQPRRGQGRLSLKKTERCLYRIGEFVKEKRDRETHRIDKSDCTSHIF
jgi:hypothetical protein